MPDVLEMSRPISLLNLADSLSKVNGGIYVDIGVYDWSDDSQHLRDDDFVILGSPDRNITIKDILKVLKLAEKRAEAISEDRTYIFEGMYPSKTKHVTRNGEKIAPKYRLGWGS